MHIAYKEIDTALCDKISTKYGEWAKKHIHIDYNSYSLAVLDDGVPVGFISAYTRYLEEPLGDEKDAYIDVIELDEKFRRIGIATEMITRTEEWAKKAGLLQIRAWSSKDKVEAIPMWRSLGYGLCPAKIWLEWRKEAVDGYYVAKQLNPINPYPGITKLMKLDIQGASEKSLRNLRLIRAKKGVYVYRCLCDGIPSVAKYFENVDDRREILNYRILNENNIPTIKVIASGEATLVMDDVSSSSEWRLGISEDLNDCEVAKRLAQWYIEFHDKGETVSELNSLYFEYDCVTRENIEKLYSKIPEASELLQYVLLRFGKLHELIFKPSFTLTYNDFYWTNFVVRKDKQAAMMFDYNLLGKGYRYSDFRNVCWSLSKDAGEAFISEYKRLYVLKHESSRQSEELLEKQIDDVASSLFSLITAFGQEKLPQWPEHAKNETLNGTLLSKVKQLLL